jgi:exodeoxyribonuclease VII small subunit
LKDLYQKELISENKRPGLDEGNDLTGLKFEPALKRLEEIVEELEKGDIDLDRSIKIFEEGVTMSKICSKRLNEMEKKIEILTRDGNNNKLKSEPFPPSCSEDGVSKETR